MLSNVTWQGYWTCLALTALFYYGIIALLFYRTDIKVFFTKGPALGKKGATLLAQPVPSAFQPIRGQTNMLQTEEEQREEEALIAMLSLLGEVQAYFEEQEDHAVNKEEILRAVSTILRKYPDVTRPRDRETINSTIIYQCQHRCALQLQEGEVAGLWPLPADPGFSPS